MQKCLQHSPIMLKLLGSYRFLLTGHCFRRQLQLSDMEGRWKGKRGQGMYGLGNKEPRSNRGLIDVQKSPVLGKVPSPTQCPSRVLCYPLHRKHQCDKSVLGESLCWTIFYANVFAMIVFQCRRSQRSPELQNPLSTSIWASVGNALKIPQICTFRWLLKSFKPTLTLTWMKRKGHPFLFLRSLFYLFISQAGKMETEIEREREAPPSESTCHGFSQLQLATHYGYTHAQCIQGRVWMQTQDLLCF